MRFLTFSRQGSRITIGILALIIASTLIGISIFTKADVGGAALFAFLVLIALSCLTWRLGSAGLLDTEQQLPGSISDLVDFVGYAHTYCSDARPSQRATSLVQQAVHRLAESTTFVPNKESLKVFEDMLLRREIYSLEPPFAVDLLTIIERAGECRNLSYVSLIASGELGARDSTILMERANACLLACTVASGLLRASEDSGDMLVRSNDVDAKQKTHR